MPKISQPLGTIKAGHQALAETKPREFADLLPIQVHLLVDASGSMERYERDTLKAVNQYVRLLHRQYQDRTCQIRLLTFSDGGTRLIYDESLTTAPSFNDLRPDGGTPLYDAIGDQINAIVDTDSFVIFVILTDGEENQSRTYTLRHVHSLIRECRRNGWLIIFLGANIDAVSNGTSMGIDPDMSLTFDMQKLTETMEAAARATTEFTKSGGLIEKAKFTEEERLAVLQLTDKRRNK